MPIASEEEIKEFLKTPKKLAIIGASTKTHKAGNYVPDFLMKRGWEIIPINPFADEILGIKTIDSLDDLDESVDGVVIYRTPEAATKEALDAMEKDIPMIWLPEGVTSEEARNAAEDRSTMYVEDKCPKERTNAFIAQGDFDE